MMRTVVGGKFSGYFCALAIFASASAFAQQAAPVYDLLLQDGHVLDDKNHIDAPMDVAIKDGKIAKVAAHIPSSTALKDDRRERALCHPGSDRPSRPCVCRHRRAQLLCRGQQRSSRWLHLPRWCYHGGRRWLLRLAQLRRLQRPHHRSLEDSRVCDAEYRRLWYAWRQIRAETRRIWMGRQRRRWRSSTRRPIVGIKTAHFDGPEWTPVEQAVIAGTKANIPVMVDFGADRPDATDLRSVDQEAATGRYLHAHVLGPSP